MLACHDLMPSRWARVDVVNSNRSRVVGMITSHISDAWPSVAATKRTPRCPISARATASSWDGVTSSQRMTSVS